MARKSSVSRLDPEIRGYIEAQLALGSMTLDQLIADLRERFPAQAQQGGLPSRSAVGRYGQKLERRLSAIKASTEAARLISEHAGDSKDARSEALALCKHAASSPRAPIEYESGGPREGTADAREFVNGYQ